MVTRQYVDVGQDDLLQPYFNFGPGFIDWQAHIRTVADYWCHVLLYAPGYDIDVIEHHRPLHERDPFTPELLDRWLAVKRLAVEPSTVTSYEWVARKYLRCLADGAVQSELLFPAIRDGGGMAVVRGFDGDAPRGIELHQTWIGRYATETAALDRLGRLVEEGHLTLRVARTFPAERAHEAHALLEQGGIRGRLVIGL